MTEQERLAAALEYQQAQQPARMNPNLAAQGARGRENMMPPTSVMDERYPAFKRNQEDVEKLMLGVDLVGSAIPLAGPAMKGAKVLGQHAAPQLAQALENYAFKTGMALPMVERQAGRAFAAPQDEALRLAQERAALPVERGGLGLPPNNTAEQRAAAMGFDVDAYHGTASKDIQKFMPEGGTPEGEKILEWYKNRQAQNEPVGYMAFRGGSFFSPKPEYAGRYAPEGTGVVYPVKLRMDNPLSLLPNAQGRYSATNAPNRNKTIDAMILQDSIDKSINEIAIIDPAQIRSRFAAFDPFRRNAAIAAAMGVAAPDLLAKEKKK